MMRQYREKWNQQSWEKTKWRKKHQEHFLEVFREIKVEKYASIYQDREEKNTKKGFVVQSTGMCVV